MSTGHRTFLFDRYVLHAKLLWRAAPFLAIACGLLSTISAAAITGAMVSSGRLVGSLPDAIAGGPGSPAAGAT